MRILFAPMEGVNGYVYRKAYNACYGGVDKYYMPFMAVGKNAAMKSREKRDILPENNEGIDAVPQILTNNATDFLAAAGIIYDYGYREVNINLGCPSGTVVTKKKGSGMLGYPDYLDNFLYEIMDRKLTVMPQLNVSVKTRIGVYETDEFAELLDIYNKYDLYRLIIHPRTQKEYYKGKVHMDSFIYAMKNSKNILCYNGDINSVDDYSEAKRQCDMTKPGSIDEYMIGRGLIGTPDLAQWIKDGDTEKTVDYDKMKEFLNLLVEGYSKEMSGEKDVLFKLKEIWIYLSRNFMDSDKVNKKICKCNTMSAYRAAEREIYDNKRYC